MKEKDRERESVNRSDRVDEFDLVFMDHDKI